MQHIDIAQWHWQGIDRVSIDRYRRLVRECLGWEDDEISIHLCRRGGSKKPVLIVRGYICCIEVFARAVSCIKRLVNVLSMTVPLSSLFFAPRKKGLLKYYGASLHPTVFTMLLLSPRIDLTIKWCDWIFSLSFCSHRHPASYQFLSSSTSQVTSRLNGWRSDTLHEL